MDISNLSRSVDTEPFRMSNSGFDILSSKSSEPIFALDRDGRFIFSNPKFREFIGYDMGDINRLPSGATYQDEATIRHHFELAADGISTSFEVFLKHKRGNHIGEDYANSER